MKLPHIGSLDSSFDSIMATDMGVLARDVFIDSKLGVNRRPGYSVYTYTANPSILPGVAGTGSGSIFGAFYWALKDRLYVAHEMDGVGNYNKLSIGVYSKALVFQAIKISPDDDQSAANSGAARHAWSVKKTHFVETADGTRLLCPTGTSILRIDTSIPTTGDTGSLYSAGGGDYYAGTGDSIQTTNAPQKCTHIAFIDQMIVANIKGSGQFQFSSVGDETSWPTGSMFTAESMPDNLVALDVWKQRIWLFGERTIEEWATTGDSDIAVRVSTFNIGLGAVDSLVKTVDGFYFLDDSFRPVLFNGTSYETLGGPITKNIQALTLPKEVISTYVDKDDRPFYIVSSHSDRKAFVFDVKNKVWYQWGKYTTTAAEQIELGYDIVTPVPAWNRYVATSTIDYKLFKLDNDLYQDNANTIKCLWETGNIDNDNYSKKKPAKLILKAKTGTAGTLMIQHNKDNAGWSPEEQISLRDSGNTDMFIPLNIGGYYRSIKFRLSFTDDYSFVFGGIFNEDQQF